MLPDGPPPGADRLGLAAEWLLFAETDLMFAQRTDLPGALLDAYCDHARQAAEKGPKAVLVALGEDPPRTHNMALLLGVLGHDLDVTGLEPATELSAYAVIGRYPDPPNASRSSSMNVLCG